MDLFTFIPWDNLINASPTTAIAIIFLVIIFKFVKPHLEALMKDHKEDRKEFAEAIEKLTKTNQVLGEEIKIHHTEVRNKLEHLIQDNKALQDKLVKILERIR